MEKKNNWIKIANKPGEIIFPENNIAKITVKEKAICVIQKDGGLKACVSKCPHAGGDLSDGYLDKRNHIVCPFHCFRFNLDSGRDNNGQGYFLKIFPIKIEKDGIFVALE
jgi:nitrite reductase/ring-hydroxylating ferredoxin subunit